MAITNTKAHGERGWTLGVNPSAIERQEAEGQRELVADSALPAKGLDLVLAADWGITVVSTRDHDPLFVTVSLPEGWSIRATDHTMWTELVDETGKVRADIFYKAAYYDRDAFVRIHRDDD